MKRVASVVVVVFLSMFALLAAQRAGAHGIPTTNPLVYSGTLLSSNGQPVSGARFILIKLWVGSTTVCSTIPGGNTTVTNGHFTIPLDSTCLDVIHQNRDVQVEVVVDGVSLGRSATSAVPYAVQADTASNPAPGSAIEALVPAGTIVAYGGTVATPPPGWLYCDGSSISRAQYQRLFLAIGTAWGADPSDNSKFNLPDLRGRFLRGVDNGLGRDPDAAGRVASNSGGSTGDSVGTVQSDMFRNHAHTQTWVYRNNNEGDNNMSGAARHGNNFHGQNVKSTDSAGGSETRPLNVAVNYIIKI